MGCNESGYRGGGGGDEAETTAYLVKAGGWGAVKVLPPEIDHESLIQCCPSLLPSPISSCME